MSVTRSDLNHQVSLGWNVVFLKEYQMYVNDEESASGKFAVCESRDDDMTTKFREFHPSIFSSDVSRVDLRC